MIPNYQTFMLPLLKFCSDGKLHKFSEAVDFLSDEFKLSQEERMELLPSGTQTIIVSRIGWARTYLKKAVLIETPERGSIQISERGRKLLSENPKEITNKFLKKYQEFKDFLALSNKGQEKNSKNDTLENSSIEETPEELIERGFKALSDNLCDELLRKILSCPPAFFERLVVKLLVAMGYGGSFSEASQVIGKPGDGGIDGIIKEDCLGLDVIYIQAKRWKEVIGRPEIQKFAGALLGQKVAKGVFITTSFFTKDAIDYAESVSQKIVLIDGQKLVSLMIEYNLGISVERTYEIKKIDNDFFDEQIFGG